MLRLEIGFLEELRQEVIAEARKAPTNPDGFISWFENLKATGPGQHDRLFPWLAERADRDEMRWFLSQEAAGEAGFDDLVAMTQVKLPARAKLELARNYWDEMGRGNAKGMHGPMLGQLVDILVRTCSAIGFGCHDDPMQLFDRPALGHEFRRDIAIDHPVIETARQVHHPARLHHCRRRRSRSGPHQGTGAGGPARGAQ